MGVRAVYRLAMDQRRRMFSLLLPVVGLAITVPEFLRLLGAPAPDPILLLIAVAFSLVFAARLVFLVYEYLRSGR
jgi:hypothetical protein